MNRKVKCTCWILTFFILVLIAAELVASLVYGLGNPPLFESSDAYGYRFIPNQDSRRFGNRIFFNAQGLRSEPIEFGHATGTIRVLCIGDSITYGGAQTDQEETYPYQLEDILNSSTSSQYEVLNASCPGWSIENEEAYLFKHGIYNSHIVILQIDSHDLFKQKRSYKIVGQLADYPNRKPIFALQEIFFKYLPKYLPFLKFKENLAEEHVLLEDIVNRNFKSMKSIDYFVSSLGGELVVLFVVLPHSPESIFALLKSEEKKFLQELKGLGIPLINTEEDFIKGGGIILFRDGIHPNPAGNKVMAKAVAKFILNRVIDKSED